MLFSLSLVDFHQCFYFVVMRFVLPSLPPPPTSPMLLLLFFVLSMSLYTYLYNIIMVNETHAVCSEVKERKSLQLDVHTEYLPEKQPWKLRCKEK